jgi:hypothetical protein
MVVFAELTPNGDAPVVPIAIGPERVQQGERLPGVRRAVAELPAKPRWTSSCRDPPSGS